MENEQPLFFKFKIPNKLGSPLDCGATHYIGDIKIEYANTFILGEETNVLPVMNEKQLDDAKEHAETAYIYETAPWWNET